MPVNNDLVQKYQREIISLFSSEQVIERCQDFLSELFTSGQSKMFIWIEELGQFVPVKKSERQENLGFEIYNEFILYLAENGNVLFKKDLAEIKSSPEVLENLNKFLEKTKADIIVPFTLHTSLLAFLTISNLQSEKEEKSKLKKFLTEIRNITTIAFSNAVLYERLQQMNNKLEEKIIERTNQLKETQSQLVQNEKLLGLGTMVAGIAHEINTPAGIIKAGIENLNTNLHSFINLLTCLDSANIFKDHQFITILQSIATKKVQRLTGAQQFRLKKDLKAQFVNMENRIDFIMEFGLVQEIEKIKSLSENNFQVLKNLSKMVHNIRNVEYSIVSVVKIVKALKYYSHLDQAPTEHVDIGEGIENTLVILNNQLKHGITLVKDIQDVPLTRCVASELNQIWTNLIMNSMHAMDNSGTIKVTLETLHIGDFPEKGTILEEAHVKKKSDGTLCNVVTIEDNGPGVPQNIQSKIFDPFFTTKGPGEGTGLGLGIVRNIVAGHNGFISFFSKPGCTRFSIFLPVL